MPSLRASSAAEVAGAVVAAELERLNARRRFIFKTLNAPMDRTRACTHKCQRPDVRFQGAGDYRTSQSRVESVENDPIRTILVLTLTCTNP